MTSWRATSSIGYLESSVFDTRAEGGAALNSILWQGNQPGGTSVDFQIAVSNCANGTDNAPTCSTGAWTFKGPNGDASLYYGTACPTFGSAFPAAGSNTPICVDRSELTNKRYVRYKVRIISDLTRSKTPIVEDIILNWSR